MSPADCPFCRIVQGLAQAAVLSETERVLAIMDLYPATRGHALVLPKAHIQDLFGMPQDLAAELMAEATKLAKAMRLVLAPAGLNLMQANGAEAGQTVWHFHLHVLPRYANDGVVLRFGHGTGPAELEQLESTATLIRGALPHIWTSAVKRAGSSGHESERRDTSP